MKLLLSCSTFVLLGVLLTGCMTPGKKKVKRAMEVIIQDLDAQNLTFEEYVDKVFANIVHRPPTATELTMFTKSAEDHGADEHEAGEEAFDTYRLNLSRDAVLAYALMLEQSDCAIPDHEHSGEEKGQPEVAQAPLVNLAGRVLSLEGAHPTYRSMRRFLDKHALSKWIKVKELKKPLEAIDDIIAFPFKKQEDLEEFSVKKGWFTPSPMTLPEYTSPKVLKDEYHHYFGYVHSHSDLSWDAEGDHREAYPHARAAGLDFFALTDHSEAFIWPWENKWKTLKGLAKKYNDNGKFVALHGFEWSNPLLGHLCVINSDDYISFLSHYSNAAVYDWVENQTGDDVFATFNHPGRGEANELDEFRCSGRDGISKFVGVEVWSKKHDFDDFWHRNFMATDKNSLNLAVQNGWYVAPIGGQDNHDPDWGTRNSYRIGVLAPKLTKKEIVQAFLARRIYATEDENLELDFRASGYPMGSRVHLRTPRTFTLTVNDRDMEETVKEVKVFCDGKSLDCEITRVGNVYTFSDTENTSAAYYYVMVEQEESVWDGENQARFTGQSPNRTRGDQAVTAPIWFK
ncbi:MAG: hypothetical protein ACI9TH_002040 [Kiritimatiellia bacterium]|jgi:hypothetical protein